MPTRAASVSKEYQLGELQIALTPNHPAHLLPPPLPPSSRVLDIGCGAGQTLVATYPDRVSVGLDIDHPSLTLGLSLTAAVRFICGNAEFLPLPSHHFDFVIARGSLMYTDIGPSLKEIQRVLKPGGQVWMTLHPISMTWKQAKTANYKGRIFFAYIVVNGILFHFTGKQFPFLGRYESFQTERGIRRALARSGFCNVEIKRGRHFLVTAAC